jgi:hypothetical protein
MALSAVHASGIQPAGYVPVHPKDRGLKLSPTSSAAHAAGFRAVIVHLIADTFDLTEDEIMWTGYVMDQALSPLLSRTAHTVPFAVRQEMLDGSYSRLLELRIKARLTRGQCQYDPTVTHPTLNEWVDALAGPVEASYDLLPTEVATLRDRISQLLVDLGVEASGNPRGATHVPADLRVRIFTDRSRRSA